ncbi:hypothetical protein OH76DRAFT_1324181, partial [Lentinus brumalis]
PQTFTPVGILNSVTRLIVCGQHALLLADDIHFRNCLVTMRPKTTRSELPTRSTVRARINNEFVDLIDNIKASI